jgi:dienelactone hydrolase
MWMGGMDILVRRNTEDWVQQAGRFLDFLRKSGRMVVLPIYSGTLERNNGRSLQRFNQGAVSMGEMINGWTKDVSRSIEYLEQNGEADMDRLAFVGLSLGAAVSPRFMAINPDFATLVLWSGGFAASSPPDLAPMNLMITESLELPVLMLNGRHDFVFPYQTHQRAYFERLGTAAEDKRHVLWDVGHFNFPVGEFFKENLDWLDKYLGPVAK